MSQVDPNLSPDAPLHWPSDQRPPRRITTPSSLMFDGTGRFQLEYATPPRPTPMTKRELVIHYLRKLEDSPFMDLLEFFGGPMKITLLLGCTLMLYGGTCRSIWAAATVITLGMLMVETVVVIWAKTK
jgi:hypothetical protein